MEQGWIKLHRNLLEHKSFWLNKDKLAIWLYLQLKATHNEATGYFEGKEITLKAGQLLASYQEIADFLDIDKGKVKRAIQSLRDDTRIDTRTDRQKSLITLIGWDNLQGTLDTRNDTAFDTRMTHDRHTFKETENEKEKRSKREKDKEKEINKNEKNERISIYSRQQSAASCQQKDDFSFPSEKDLDRWLNQRTGDRGQEIGNEADSFALANPIQPKKKEININSPLYPPSFAAGEITQNACMSSSQRDACNQPQGCMSSAAGESDNVAPYTLSPDPYTLFDEFWKAYPKKIGKGYAFECFKKIRVSRSLLDTMLEAIAKQKKSDMWKRDKGQYIPNPSTWLNQKRWEDDLGGDTEDDGQIPWSKFNLGIVL